MADVGNDELIKVIVSVAIALLYGILAIVRRADRWIKEHRVPKPEVMEDPYHRAKPAPPAYQPAPQRQPQPQAARPQLSPAEMLDTLLREGKLPEARRMDEEEEARKEPATLYPQRPMAQYPPTVVKAAKRPASAPKPRLPLAAPSLARPVAAASIVYRHFDNLRVLRSKADLKRALLLHEILSPPVTMRRHGRALPTAMRRIA